MPEIPAALRALLEDFTALGGRDRVQLLIELADSLPPLPQRYVDDPSSLEPVPECQSPIALAVTVEDGVVRLFFDAHRPPRRRAGSPASCTKASTARRSRRCSPCRPTYRTGSAWVTRSARCDSTG